MLLGTYLARRRKRRAERILIDQIHGEIVAAARAPELFRDFGIPDDLDGRFEMMTLHAGLMLRRLADFGGKSGDLGQALLDRLFEGFDDALREMAISDAGVMKRLKHMVGAFHGRNKVYGEALAAADPSVLAAALARNAYRAGAGPVPPPARALARRVMTVARGFDSVSLECILEGRFRYPKSAGDGA
jgi:cytochrome b pre-mRNA-processing protein 3